MIHHRVDFLPARSILNHMVEHIRIDARARQRWSLT
jgi:hypothetical protein